MFINIIPSGVQLSRECCPGLPEALGSFPSTSTQQDWQQAIIFRILLLPYVKGPWQTNISWSPVSKKYHTVSRVPPHWLLPPFLLM